MEALTEWFSWPSKPARFGYYEFRGLTYAEPVKMLFNGCTFGWLDPGDGKWIPLADDQSDEWRGLAGPNVGIEPQATERRSMQMSNCGLLTNVSSNEWLGGPVPAHELLAWLRDDFERGLSSQGCEAAADEIERLRADHARVLALQQASYEREISVEVEIERERLRGYFREALADKGITWPGEVDILYDKCFAASRASDETPNVVLTGARKTGG